MSSGTGQPGGPGEETLFCQACGTPNPSDQEFCARCQQKLMVLSGSFQEAEPGFEGEVGDEEGFSLDEHLLERISILEEAMKRTAETVHQILGAINKQERNILVNQTAVGTLREVLEGKRVLDPEEWSELWEHKMEYQMLALEKRERFVGLKGRFAALYQGDRRKQFDELLNEAEYALFALDLDRALKALEHAYKLDRSNYELAYFLGETFFNEGEPGRALPYFQRVLELEPDHFEGLVYGGVLHHEQGKTARAEELLKRAVALYPDAFLPRFSLGAIYAGQGNLKQAVVLLEDAVALEAVPQAHFLLGSCFHEMGKVGAAIKHLQEVVRHDPSYEEAYHLLGLAYLDRNWNKKALSAFRQAQRLDPKKLSYQDLVRYLSGQAGSPLPEVDDAAQNWLETAEQLLDDDKPERALAAYQKALTSDPDNPTLLISCAMACLHLDRAQESQKYARRVLDLEPGEMLQATAYATLIEALRSEGRYREGNRVGKRLLAAGASNYARTIAYYEMAYNLAEMEENLDQALEYARRSLELAPEELRQFPLAALGWVHYKRQEYEQAIDLLERSQELGPSATTLTHLGMALLASGREERARDTLAAAREPDGTSTSLEERMMECLKASSRLHQRVRQGQKR